MTAQRPAGVGPRGEPDDDAALRDILSKSRTRVVFGAGKLSELGRIAKAEGARRVLLVTDAGIVKAGHVDRGVAALRDAGLTVTVFDGVEANPTTEHVAAGVIVARRHSIDFLIGLGGGSSMDCAKGVNFILTNGGEMVDYWGVGKASRPMLPMIAVPTTAGTGSEAQSFALICDPVTHQKMACGDPKAACRVAILDPDLTRTQPPEVAAAAGMDAVSHAVETAATTSRNDVSLEFTRQAWARLNASFESALRDPADDAARAKMLMGAHLAGAAVEHSMLGAAHACANPLTARLGMTHGVAVGLLLPHVVRFNSAPAAGRQPRGHWEAHPYGVLCDDPGELALRIEAMLTAACLPRFLQNCNVPWELLPELANEAAGQRTAQYNPRRVGAKELLEIYQTAFQ